VAIVTNHQDANTFMAEFRGGLNEMTKRGVCQEEIQDRLWMPPAFAIFAKMCGQPNTDLGISTKPSDAGQIELHAGCSVAGPPVFSWILRTDDGGMEITDAGVYGLH
jgi:hypothetical protein